MNKPKLTIKDLDPIFADGKLPDYPVELFADGGPATITWKWNFVRHAEEDDEQPAEGTNHLRIDVNSEWIPLDPDNIPTPNKEYMLLIKEGGYGYFFTEYTSNINNGKLYLHACYGDKHLDEKRVNGCYGATYKLIKL